MKMSLKAFNSLHWEFDTDLTEKGQKYLVTDFSPLQAMNLSTKSLRRTTLLLQQINTSVEATQKKRDFCGVKKEYFPS